MMRSNDMKALKIATQLVEIKGQQIVTDSLTVAEKFEKRHDHVMRDIEKLIDCDCFNAPKFGAVTYVDKKGESRK